MTTKQKKQEVKKILYELEDKLKKIALPIDENKVLNLKKFNDLPEIRKVSELLKKMRITRYWLYDNHFVGAATFLSLGEEMRKETIQIYGKDLLI